MLHHASLVAILLVFEADCDRGCSGQCLVSGVVWNESAISEKPYILPAQGNRARFAR